MELLVTGSLNWNKTLHWTFIVKEDSTSVRISLKQSNQMVWGGRGLEHHLEKGQSECNVVLCPSPLEGKACLQDKCFSASC